MDHRYKNYWDLVYRNYFDSLPCYVTVQDRNHNVLDASRRFREDFGGFEGRSCYQVFKNRSEPCEVCPVERTFHDKRPHRGQEKVVCLDGREVDVIIEPRISDLLVEENWVERDWYGHSLWFYEFDEGILWGATAFMMRELLDHLRSPAES